MSPAWAQRQNLCVPVTLLAAELPSVLKPDGMALFVLTSHGDCAGMLDGLAQASLSVERLLWRHFGVETMAIYAARLARVPTVIQAPAKRAIIASI